MATVLKPIMPTMARMARAALVMDSVDLALDTTAIHRAYPDLPSTRLADLLARAVGTPPRR
jgi:hypothetical protein